MFKYFVIVISTWLLATTSWSCQVPVFRYALERWDSAQFRLLVMHRELIAPEVQKTLLETQSQLGGESPKTNLSLETVDVSKLTEQTRWSLPDLSIMKSDPYMALIEPTKDQLVHSGPYTADAMSDVLDSPARRAWVKQITSGASVVWLVVPASDDDGSASQLLKSTLLKAEQEITIPEGVLTPDEVHEATGDIDLEDVLRSPIPLKISFPVLQVDRSDPKEAAFISMLTHGLSDEAKLETLIIPLFGRGRMLQPLPASMLTEDRILAGCRYLCGACSCQVKDQNPGRDLVITEDWDQHLQSGLVVVEKSLPPLEGVGDLADAAIKSEPSTNDVSSPVSQIEQSADTPMNATLITVVGIMALLGLGTVFVMKKKS